MKKGFLLLILLGFIACSSSSSDEAENKNSSPVQQIDGTLIADGNSNDTYALIVRSGYNHEAPDSSREHKTAHFQHIQQIYDKQLNKYVFAFYIHALFKENFCISKHEK